MEPYVFSASNVSVNICGALYIVDICAMLVGAPCAVKVSGLYYHQVSRIVAH